MEEAVKFIMISKELKLICTRLAKRKSWFTNPHCLSPEAVVAKQQSQQIKGFLYHSKSLYSYLFIF
jgi:hypothetical protein